MDSSPNGHTEDGIIFEVMFERWSDGSTILAEIDVIPTWVENDWVDGKAYYAICPIVPFTDVWATYDRLISTDSLIRSYNRTVSILGEGIDAVRDSMGLIPMPAYVG